MEESIQLQKLDTVKRSIIGDVEETKAWRIQKVTKSLLREDTKMFYHPQVVFLGPYHFNGIEKKDDEMERKTDIARDVHLRLKKRKEKEKSSAGVDESPLITAIEIFKKKEENLRASYAEKIEVSGAALAWMMMRDGCFVLHVLQRFRQDESEETEFASINPLTTDIVKDVLMMENQLPFWALKDINPQVNVEWLVSALKNLSPISVANVRGSAEYKGEFHVLQLLRDYIVDTQQGSACSCCFHCSPWGILSWKFYRGYVGLEFERDDFSKLFCSLLRLGYNLIWTIILIVWFPVLFILFMIFVCGNYAPLEWENVLTVGELKKIGVKFKGLNSPKRGISHIKFNSSTFYLPQFEVDKTSEVILRNLIAYEICSKEEEKPVTSYALMMNGLINTKDDVAILRREDIIINKLGSDEEVAGLWNSIVRSIEVPKYKPVDNAVSGIDRYRKRKWKILWAQFVLTHCSKPWLFLSLLVAFILLTFLQKICLSVSCQSEHISSV